MFCFPPGRNREDKERNHLSIVLFVRREMSTCDTDVEKEIIEIRVKYRH